MQVRLFLGQFARGDVLHGAHKSHCQIVIGMHGRGPHLHPAHDAVAMQDTEFVGVVSYAVFHVLKPTLQDGCAVVRMNKIGPSIVEAFGNGEPIDLATTGINVGDVALDVAQKDAER